MLLYDYAIHVTGKKVDHIFAKFNYIQAGLTLHHVMHRDAHIPIIFPLLISNHLSWLFGYAVCL